MKKVYFDQTISNGCTSIFMRNTEVVPTGTTIYAMPIEDKNNEYDQLAEQYDVHFIFEDYMPEINFYTVPQIDIMAVDSDEGYIGTLGGVTDLEAKSPICYIDRNKVCYLIAPNLQDFLKNIADWKKNLVLYKDVLFYPSKACAEMELEFISICDVEGGLSLTTK